MIVGLLIDHLFWNISILSLSIILIKLKFSSNSFNETNNNLQNLTVKKVMTLNPVSIKQDTLAEKALSIMNIKKITSLCVHSGKNKKKTIGILHIHSILHSNIH